MAVMHLPPNVNEQAIGLKGPAEWSHILAGSAIAVQLLHQQARLSKKIAAPAGWRSAFWGRLGGSLT
jgi:hypothetical protein